MMMSIYYDEHLFKFNHLSIICLYIEKFDRLFLEF